MKKVKINNKDLAFWAMTAIAIFCNILIYRLQSEIADLKSKPAIIYQVDNAGSAMIGKVVGKEIIDGKYTLDLGVYGKFLVPKDVYDSVEVGDDIPDEVRGK